MGPDNALNILYSCIHTSTKTAASLQHTIRRSTHPTTYLLMVSFAYYVIKEGVFQKITLDYEGVGGFGR